MASESDDDVFYDAEEDVPNSPAVVVAPAVGTDQDASEAAASPVTVVVSNSCIRDADEPRRPGEEQQEQQEQEEDQEPEEDARDASDDDEDSVARHAAARSAAASLASSTATSAPPVAPASSSLLGAETRPQRARTVPHSPRSVNSTGSNSSGGAMPRPAAATGGVSVTMEVGVGNEPAMSSVVTVPLAEALQGLESECEQHRVAYTEAGEQATVEAERREVPPPLKPVPADAAAVPTTAAAATSSAAASSAAPSTGNGQAPEQQEEQGEFVVKNLDTGERFAIDEVGTRVEQGVDPLALHLAQMSTAQHAAEPEAERPANGASLRLPGSPRGARPGHQRSVSDSGMRRPSWLKWGKSSSTEALSKLVERQDDAGSSGGGGGGGNDESLETSPTGGAPPVSPDEPPSIAAAHDARTTRVHAHKKNQKEFNRLLHVQTLGDHVGAVFVMRFNTEGRYLATAGQDYHVRVWEVDYNVVPSLRPKGQPPCAPADADAVFCETPLHVYAGHQSHVLDVAWSKQDFLLSASMDKTVRLWHVTRQDCLCVFKHVEFVTTVAWHPVEESVFLSASLDHKLRVWNVLEKRVIHWVDTGDLLTAACFSSDGRLALAGSYHGKCTLYSKEGLEYITTIEVRSRRGKNAKAKKITGIQMSPDGKKVLITSNDSRIRLYSMRDYSEVCKYKGLLNEQSQIRASFSPDGRYIICGSQDNRVLIWNTVNTYIPPINPAFLLRYRRDRSESYESFVAHSRHVLCAIFAPFRLPRHPTSRASTPDTPSAPMPAAQAPGATAKAPTPPPAPPSIVSPRGLLSPRAAAKQEAEQAGNPAEGLVVVSCDYEGVIKVHVNRSWEPTPL